MTLPLATPERLEAVLAELGLHTERNEDGGLTATFAKAEATFFTDGPVTTARAISFRGTHDEESGNRMREVLNRLNMAAPLGTAFTAGTDWGAAVAFRYHFVSQSGVSDSQLAAIFDLFLKSFFALHDQVEAVIPNLSDGPLASPEPETEA